MILVSFISCDSVRSYAAFGGKRSASVLDQLLVIGERGSFGWVRPEHIEPTGALSSADIRATLHRQLGEFLIHLERVGGGVEALCRVTMTVNALGKIDLYQWLYFLAQHARRHLQQLAALEAEFAAGAERFAERKVGPDCGCMT